MPVDQGGRGGIMKTTTGNMATPDTIVTKSTVKPKLAIVQGTHPGENLNRLEAMDASVPTRSRMLASLVADPEMRRRIGGAWPLYLMLILEWNGSAAGTRDEIGDRMGEDGRNVANWVAALERAEVLKVERSGRKMTVSLVGEHMGVARMPDSITVAGDPGAPEPALDGRQRDILDLMEKARSMGGEAEVRIIVKSK